MSSSSERRAVRVRVRDDDGSITFVDPDPTMLPVIQELDPSFRVIREPLPGFDVPRLWATARLGCGIARADLLSAHTHDLWEAHDEETRAVVSAQHGEASHLDLKIELARRLLSYCELCGLRCGVNRNAGKTGRCGLRTEAHLHEAYVHVAEEPPINPSLNISLRGCGLRCRFCQQFAALQPTGTADEQLTGNTWTKLDARGARSLTFVGGNPTESLYAILRFLAAAPASFKLPVVWNSSGYDSPVAIRLLAGVADGYVPDWKYGNDHCALELSGAAGYTNVASQALEQMTEQRVPVFVRMLVLPGHVECCHLRALELLADWRGSIRLNVLDQYAPDFLIRPSDGALACFASRKDVQRVRAAARSAGFQVF